MCHPAGREKQNTFGRHMFTIFCSTGSCHGAEFPLSVSLKKLRHLFVVKCYLVITEGEKIVLAF